MSVERKRRNGSWGFRFTQAGNSYKRYGFPTRAEAKEAEIQFRAQLKSKPPLPPTALGNVVANYLTDSADPGRGRSMWRLDHLRLSLRKHIIGYFGETKLITEITDKDIEGLILKLKRQGLKPKSVWHAIIDLRACLYYAVRNGLLYVNPAQRFGMKWGSLIGSTKSRKPPMDMAAVDRAAESIKHPVDRAWFDVCRFTGMRLDECNRLQWPDIDFNKCMIHIPGTKTEESDSWLPLAPVALRALIELREKVTSNSEFVFPGRAPQNKGKKAYSRMYLFKTIERKTGVRLKAKDLRDYFCSEVASKVSDPSVLMKLMRHTNLNTTTNYLRTVEDRMRHAVQNLGASSGGKSGGKFMQITAPNYIDPKVLALANLLISQGFMDQSGDSKMLDSVAISHAEGFSGTPRNFHTSSARQKASCTTSSANARL